MKLLITFFLATLVASFVAVPSSAAADTNTATAKPSQIQKQVESLPDLKTVLTNIESSVPEFGSIGMTTGIPSSGQVWHGEEYASAVFVLRKNIRYHPAGEFPRAMTPVPYGDLRVTIARYASSGEAQQAVEKSLFERPATFQPKATYKGATLYEYQGASGRVMTAICQSRQYIVEINPNSEGASPLVMKVLDVVLAELDSTSSKSK